jgi:hypothetical protein
LPPGSALWFDLHVFNQFVSKSIDVYDRATTVHVPGEVADHLVYSDGDSSIERCSKAVGVTAGSSEAHRRVQ